jgi:hypothetical protein
VRKDRDHRDLLFKLRYYPIFGGEVMTGRTRKFSGRIILERRRSVLFQTGEKTSFLPKISVTVERADGRTRFAPGEVTMHIPSRMAERKFGPGRRR